MTNRQEVAKKLREAGEAAEEVGTYPASALNDITNIIAINEITSYQDFFTRLANLIDPTCHQVIEDETQVCSECSEDLDEGYGWDFCPHCGARVVRDGNN